MRAGLTLVELMIVVSIIGLLAVLAMPSVLNARRRVQNAAFANDLRMISSALDRYAIEHRDYPPDAEGGWPPAGIAGYLPRRFSWEAETLIGGRWEWRRALDRTTNVLGICYAAIVVARPQRTTAQMTEVDASFDDGDLDTGRFRRREDRYVYIVE